MQFCDASLKGTSKNNYKTIYRSVSASVCVFCVCVFWVAKEHWRTIHKTSKAWREHRVLCFLLLCGRNEFVSGWERVCACGFFSTLFCFYCFHFISSHVAIFESEKYLNASQTTMLQLSSSFLPWVFPSCCIYCCFLLKPLHWWSSVSQSAMLPIRRSVVPSNVR